MDADPPEITGKARVEQGSNRQTHLFWSTGVLGTACWKGEPGNWGRPVLDEGCGLNVACRAAVCTGVGQGRMTDEAG